MREAFAEDLRGGEVDRDGLRPDAKALPRALVPTPATLLAGRQEQNVLQISHVSPMM